MGINGLDKAGNTALYWGCHGGHKGDKHYVLISDLSMDSLLNTAASPN